MIIPSLIWLAYILIDAVVNWYMIEKLNINPIHLVLFILRGFIAILWGAFVIDSQPYEFLAFVAFTGGSFWIVFDVALNVLRGKSVSYIGYNSLIDRFGLKYEIAFWIFKVAACYGVVWSYWFLNKTR